MTLTFWSLSFWGATGAARRLSVSPIGHFVQLRREVNSVGISRQGERVSVGLGVARGV